MRAIHFAVLLAGLVPALAWACPPNGFDAKGLAALKAGGFQVAAAEERQGLALALADCLADPDPTLRDGIAYEALTTWLRADALDAPTRQALMLKLIAWIEPGATEPVAAAPETDAETDAESEAGSEADTADTEDEESAGDAVAEADAVAEGEPAPAAAPETGFRAPFAALVLSEVARTDRIAAWMTPYEREALLEAGTDYLESVTDYRGYDEATGWRHGVAHGADLLMQLALNPALDGAQRMQLLAAVGTQVAPADHFYIYGEPERLSRPVLFVLASKSVDEVTWKAWLQKIAAPAPLASWRDAYSSQAGMAKRHNTRAFLLALYAGTLGSDDPAMQAFAASIAEVLRTVG